MMQEKTINIQYDDVKLRRFSFDDIPMKIKWINNKSINKYLHYNLPLEYNPTCQWFNRTKDDNNRIDAVIEYKDVAVGLIGLLGIDRVNLKAEEYIVIGEENFQGMGIANKAGLLLQNYSFSILGLNKIYAYTEVENESSINLYSKRGFVKEGRLDADLFYNEKFIDRYIFSLFNNSNISIDDDVIKANVLL